MSYVTASGYEIEIPIRDRKGYVTASGKVFPYSSGKVTTFTRGDDYDYPTYHGDFTPNCEYNKNFDWQDAVTLLGSGAFSTVYPACKKHSSASSGLPDCKYAAKVSSIDASGRRKAYDTELKVYQILNHENFGIKIAPKMFDHWLCTKRDDFGRTLKYGIIILERLGKNLSELTSLPSDTKVNLVYQLLTKIRALGNLGLYHYDIKAENVMITADGKNLYITDYGTVGDFNRADKKELDFYTGNMFLQAEPVVLRILSLPTEEPKKPEPKQEERKKEERKQEEPKAIVSGYVTASGDAFLDL